MDDPLSCAAMSESLQRLLELLDLERLEVNLFRGRSPADAQFRIFGGQVLAQALVAARRTVDDDRLPHSLHAYFLRPGDPQVPIVFDVDRIRDGRSFTTRRVVAIQKGEAIYNMSASFQIAEDGLEHQIDAPETGPPDGEPDFAEVMRDAAAERGHRGDPARFGQPVEVRTVGGMHAFDATPRPPRMDTWIRARGALPDDPGLHMCVLAYASDLTLMANAVYPHATSMMRDGFRSATLDHAMWFHRPFRVDDWILHVQDSPVSARARALCRGTFFTRAGELVASCVQEGMMRAARDGSAH